MRDCAHLNRVDEGSVPVIVLVLASVLAQVKEVVAETAAWGVAAEIFD
jgi:hypothetical protein